MNDRTRVVVRPDAQGTWETVLQQRHLPTSFYLSRATYQSAIEYAHTVSGAFGIPITVVLRGEG